MGSASITKARNRHVLTDADIAKVVTAYHTSFDTDGNPVDPDGDGGLAARFVTITEIVEAGYDLSVDRYIKQAAAEPDDLDSLINAYNLARAERQKTEVRMFDVLTAAGIDGFDE
ncbi:N-6 DNA methylase [Nonomuraea sp. NPDC049400]|uniref:N-6 DNA methylase n=1 Tax=Nonomuraea sp. NPDC049400 TaxID=3364352 RepID=UPI0037B54590